MNIVFSIWRQLEAWRRAWKEIITGKKRYAPRGVKDTFTSHRKGCHQFVRIQKRKLKSKLGGIVRLSYAPNQSWNVYGLGIQDLESVLAIFCPRILHLEKEDRETLSKTSRFPWSAKMCWPRLQHANTLLPEIKKMLAEISEWKSNATVKCL